VCQGGGKKKRGGEEGGIMENEKAEGRLRLIQTSGGRENWRVEKRRAEQSSGSRYIQRKGESVES
ncbi:hypothetical protein PanWU01x14_168710, partial [Parasponia andersonii]